MAKKVFIVWISVMGLIIILSVSIQLKEFWDIRSCKKIGGKLMYNYECASPTSDGGKECTDSSQCESYCQSPDMKLLNVPVEGRCYGWQKANGMCEVRDGLADGCWSE